MKSKFGLMMGGGGAKGAYQLGVLVALYEMNIFSKISYISGTSIGAINAFLCGTCKSITEHMEVWAMLEMEDVFRKPREDKKGLYDVNHLKEILLSRFGYDITNFHYEKEVYVTASKLKNNTVFSQIDLFNLEKVAFHLNKCDFPVDAVMASSSIPIVFGSVKIGDDYYVDGGLTDQNPFHPILKNKVNCIFSVPLGLWVSKLSPGYYDYSRKAFLNIDFLAPGLFGGDLLSELANGLNFTTKFKEKIYYIGYVYAKRLLEYCFAQHYLYYKDGLLCAKRFGKYKRVRLKLNEMPQIHKEARILRKNGHVHIFQE